MKKYTLYIYCDHDENCDYENSVIESDEHILVACKICREIASIERKIIYYTECLACGEEMELGENFEISDSKMRCMNCSLVGNVGFKEFDKTVLFDVLTKVKTEEKCKVCKCSEWENMSGKDLVCPKCRRVLRYHLSSKWKE
jgi:hypothetical protein